jgi:hypothetical protein
MIITAAAHFGRDRTLVRIARPSRVEAAITRPTSLKTQPPPRRTRHHTLADIPTNTLVPVAIVGRHPDLAIM